MDDNRKKRATPDARPPGERRRIGTVVHDDRGNASVRWRDAPAGHDRPVLEVLGEASLSVKAEDDSGDPYARRHMRRPDGGRTRTDLRRLSEWIKMMRELEERRRNGGEDE